MATNHIADQLLQRFFDGDLRDAQASEVQGHIDGCAQCAASHRSLVVLSEMFRVAAEEAGAGVDFEALYRRVEEGAHAANVTFIDQVKVRWSELIEHQQQIWMPAACSLAVAAAVLLAMNVDGLAGNPPPQVVADGPRVVKPPAPEPQPAMHASMIPTEIVAIDFGSNTGTVFQIDVADGVSTAVVWINDEVEE